MAIITLIPGAPTIETEAGYSVAIDTVTASTASLYSWESNSSGGNFSTTTSVSLIGAFTYDAQGAPSGTVEEIQMDADNDGTADFIIDFASTSSASLSDLTSGDLKTFFGAAFSEDDTVELGFIAETGFFTPMYLGGAGPESDDDITIRRNLNVGGDSYYANGKTGGNDTFNLYASTEGGYAEIYGDFHSADSSVFGQTPTATGGNDMIYDHSPTYNNNFREIIISGDVNRMRTSDFNGGNDLIVGDSHRIYAAGDVFQLSGGSMTLNAGDDTITGSSSGDSLAGDYTFLNRNSHGVSEVYHVFGGDDSIEGGGGDDEIWGEGPTETSGTLIEVGGDDTLHGGDGDDTIDGGGGDDSIRGDDGEDMVQGGIGADFIQGGAGNDTVSGNSGSDIVQGGAGDDLVGGETGSDLLFGGDGNDKMFGGAGNDFLSGDAGIDLLNGGDGYDTAVYSDITDDIVVNLNLSTYQAVSSQAGSDRLVSIEGVVGGSGNDILVGNSQGNIIDGGLGDDTIYGLGGGDILVGGEGNDQIEGSGGDDLMFGDEGDADVLSYYNSGGNVTVNLRYQGTAQNVGASSGTDTFVGFEDLYGSNVGSDTLVGGADDNRILGFGGSDLIFGFNGDDELFGMKGRDILIGGAGADTLTGGGGADTFDFNTIGDSTSQSRDTITDFGIAGVADKIDLSTIDADSAAAGDQAFNFVGSAALATAGDLRFATNGTDGFVLGDTNGDGNADLNILLMGITSMSATDFVL